MYTFTAIKVRHHVAMFCLKGPNLLYTTAVDTTRSLLNDSQQEVCHAVGLTSILCTLVVQLRLFMTTVVVTSCVLFEPRGTFNSKCEH